MKNSLYTLPIILIFLMGFGSIPLEQLPTFPISEHALIGKWQLKKIELYDIHNTLKNTIIEPIDEEHFKTIIQLLPQNNIRVLTNHLINDDAISNTHKWYLNQNSLIIKKESTEVEVKVKSFTQQAIVLEMTNPSKNEKEYKAKIYFARVK
ncbi:hypothetical protein LNQ81_02280 [Myroides sp. M-43]|uniref:hypothetical protein n=1 Tax=Myroides oncorhynchi TaxID=2893756 RepID=UPI001E5F7A62|nr:hypothetical protein [Myroides oncorhynchi]MCC9041544.1 hypothetical protein [Myroides oncorhynchi]